jgi:hypothetical protein
MFSSDIEEIVASEPSASVESPLTPSDEAFLERVRTQDRLRDLARASELEEDEPEAEELSAQPPARPGSGHSFFDSLAFANSFDAGERAVDFELLDAALSRDERRAVSRRERARGAASGAGLMESELADDFAEMGLEPPAGYGAAQADEEDADLTAEAEEEEEAEVEAEEPEPAEDEAEAQAAPDATPAPSFDVRYEVPLVPQQAGMSCWAAAAAMVVAWRDGVAVDPSELAAGSGRWREYQAGLQNDDSRFFEVWGLATEPAQSFSVAGFRELLERYGPLWVASADAGPHVRVVAGMSGDGGRDSTTLTILDPWEPEMEQFRLPNAGGRATETYSQFVVKQESFARATADRPSGVFVAHAQQPLPTPGGK